MPLARLASTALLNSCADQISEAVAGVVADRTRSAKLGTSSVYTSGKCPSALELGSSGPRHRADDSRDCKCSRGSPERKWNRDPIKGHGLRGGIRTNSDGSRRSAPPRDACHEPRPEVGESLGRRSFFTSNRGRSQQRGPRNPVLSALGADHRERSLALRRRDEVTRTKARASRPHRVDRAILRSPRIR